MAAYDPFVELNERRKQAANHAREAREWAEAADREAAEGQNVEAVTYAAVAQAHGLAAIATGFGGGILSVEDLKR